MKIDCFLSNQLQHTDIFCINICRLLWKEKVSREIEPRCASYLYTLGFDMGNRFNTDTLCIKLCILGQLKIVSVVGLNETINLFKKVVTCQDSRYLNLSFKREFQEIIYISKKPIFMSFCDRNV